MCNRCSSTWKLMYCGEGTVTTHLADTFFHLLYGCLPAACFDNVLHGLFNQLECHQAQLWAGSSFPHTWHSQFHTIHPLLTNQINAFHPPLLKS